MNSNFVKITPNFRLSVNINFVTEHQYAPEILSGEAVGTLRDCFRGSHGDNLSAAVAAFGSKVYHVIRALNHV